MAAPRDIREMKWKRPAGKRQASLLNDPVVYVNERFLLTANLQNEFSQGRLDLLPFLQVDTVFMRNTG
jgi:hypothetical protein